ncbi:MAG: AAA family ATPase, partial [Thiohalobacterales bacterium]
MYETFYQLSADPFRLSPDPRFCFQHRTYRKAMTYMLHALYRAEGFIMITGRPGTGKTTLINDLIQTLKPDQAVVAKIVSTQLTADDLLELVAYAFNLNPRGCGKAEVLVQVERFLKQQYQHGRHPLLIVDEAQDMNERALEELRLLTNMQVGNHQLLQIFLVGQEQLRKLVISPSLEQLHQRLIAATLLEPLDTDDTRAYIKHRLHRVNWKGDPLISTEAYAMINRYSHGIPRQINQICSRLFLHGSVEEKHRLGLADLKIIIEELQEELLLPIDKEGINDAAPWPAELHEETYEEEPQASPPAPESVPPATETLPETEPADQEPPAIAADTSRHTPAREPASVAGTGDTDNNHQPENPTASKESRRLHSWGLLSLPVLLAGLLLILVYTTSTQFTRLTNQNLATSEHSGEREATSIAAGEFSHKISEADEDMRMGTVVRQSSPPGQAPKSN